MGIAQLNRSTELTDAFKAHSSNLGALEPFLLQNCTQRIFVLELGRLKTPRRSLMSLANKLDQIAWVLCAWGRCCSEDVKHLGKPDSSLCGICMMLAERKRGLCWHFFRI